MPGCRIVLIEQVKKNTSQQNFILRIFIRKLHHHPFLKCMPQPHYIFAFQLYVLPDQKLLNSCYSKIPKKKSKNEEPKRNETINPTTSIFLLVRKKSKPYKDFYLLSNQNFQLNLFSNFNHRMHKYQHAWYTLYKLTLFAFHLRSSK